MFKTISFLAVLLLPAVASADPTWGPQSAYGTLAPHTYNTHTVLLNAGETTRFSVDGAGADIDCFLYDNNDILVGQDDDATSTCLIDVRPRYSAVFTLKVVNATNRRTSYEALAY